MAFKSDASACTSTRLPWKVAKKITKTMSVDDTDGSLVIENPVEINDDLHVTTISAGYNVDSQIVLQEGITADVNIVHEKMGIVEVHFRATITPTTSYARIGTLPAAVIPGHVHTFPGTRASGDGSLFTAVSPIKIEQNGSIYAYGLGANVVNTIEFVTVYMI